MNLWSISDLHIYLKGEGVDENALLSFLASIPDKSLVLNGDIFDLWRRRFGEIRAEHTELIDALVRKARVYVIGNHDSKMLSMENFYGVPIVEKYIIGNTIFLHGHQFDAMNSDGNSVGRYLTKWVSWIDTNLVDGIEPIARDIEGWIRRTGRFGTPEIYKEKGLDYVMSFLVEGGRSLREITRVVMAHTHMKWYHRVGDLQVVNTGTWLRGKNDVTKIYIEGGWVE